MNSINPRLVQKVREFPGKTILVIGDLILDEFVWGRVDRISPEAPVPVIQVSNQSFRLGGAANVAANLAALGAQTFLVGVIGEDWAGKRLLQELEDRDISREGIVVDCDRPTTVKTRIIAHHQQVCRTDRESPLPLGPDKIAELDQKVSQGLELGQVVVLSDYAKGVLTADTTPGWIAKARQRNLFTAVDPKVNHFSIYSGASIVTPNLKEAQNATGMEIVDDDSAVAAGQQLRRTLSADHLLLTRGEQGMTLFGPEGSQQIHTVAREVFDVTGAGDTVVATLALAVAAGASVYESAILANCAAGVVVGKLGTATATPDEIVSMLLTLEPE